MRILSALKDDELILTWADGSQFSYSFFWLRDHARDESSFDARSHQRKLFTAGIDTDIEPRAVEVIPDGTALLIAWPDLGEPIRYEAEFLYQLRSPGLDSTRKASVLWDTTLDAPTLSFNVLKEDDGHTFTRMLSTHGFVLVTDCPIAQSANTVQELADYLGYIRNSLFGSIWSFEADEAMDDSAYSTELLRPHTDGTYSLDPPGVQILLCVERGSESVGGESIMVDGFKIAADLKAQDPNLYHELTRIEVPGIYLGDGAILKATHPIFREISGELVQVCFNNYDRDAVRLPDDDMEKLYTGIRQVDQALNNKANQWRHVLNTGEALIFDNWRVLHGRTAYRGARQMTGAYLNHEDLLSRYRQLGLLA